MTRRRSHIQTAPSRPRRGFSLIEVLVVIAVIALLITLVVGAGVSLVGKGRASATQDLLRTLDRALEEYLATNNNVIPPYNADSYDLRPVMNSHIQGVGDLVLNTIEPYPSAGSQHSRRPDAGVFLRQSRGFGETDAVIQGLPDRFIVTTPIGTSATNPETFTSVIDIWGRTDWPPTESSMNEWRMDQQQFIYYVHPDNSLAQDLYGQCVNRRPYFMSAGPDGKYGLRSETPQLGEDSEDYRRRVHRSLEDNIYSYPGVAGTHRQDTAFFEAWR